MVDAHKSRTVGDFMINPVHSVTPKVKLREVAELFLARDISGCPVVDEAGRLISLIGQGDILKLAASEGVEATIAHCLPKLVQTQNLITLKKEAPFQDAYKLFLKHSIHRIPIVDANGKLGGMISRGVILKMIVEAHYGKKAS